MLAKNSIKQISHVQYRLRTVVEVREYLEQGCGCDQQPLPCFTLGPVSYTLMGLLFAAAAALCRGIAALQFCHIVFPYSAVDKVV